MDCDCYLGYKNAIKIMLFYTECLKCGQKLLFIADYFIPKTLTMFEYWKKRYCKICFVAKKRCTELYFEYNVHGVNVMKHNYHHKKNYLASLKIKGKQMEIIRKHKE